MKTYKIMPTAEGTYSATKLYNVLDEVQGEYGLYRSVKEGNIGHPLTDSTWWVKVLDITPMKNAVEDAIEQTASAKQISDNIEAQENIRKANEQNRQSQETTRESKESTRQSQETTRQSQESTRQSQESTRQSQESTRQSQETTRQSQETTRQSQEDQRKTQENQRIINEQSRQAAFEDKQNSRQATFNASEEARRQVFNSKEVERDAVIQEISDAATGLSIVNGIPCITFNE